MSSSDDAKAYRRAYYVKNRERIKAKSRAYAVANAARVAEYQRVYRLKNHERLVAYNEINKARNAERYRSWYAANVEKKRAYAREWGRAHRDHKRSAMRTYMHEYTRRPEVIEATRYNRRIREYRTRGAAGHATYEQIEARCAFYGHRCVYCGEEATTIDHVIPIARGGANWPANLRPACRSCNSAKRDTPLAEFLERK